MESHKSLCNKLDLMITNKKIPHIIFHGPSGSGKRELLEYFIQRIYETKTENIKRYVMYVNCAHSKGIRFIRDKLKFFAKTNIQSKKGTFFKSIVLFNADKLTTDAQSALRRCIERFSHTTRFFIIVEDRNKLLKPILSRFCNISVRQKNSLVSQKKTNIKKQQWLKKQLKNKKHFISLQKCLQLSLKLYEKGYHIYDLFNYIETMDLPNKYFYLVYFDSIRMEFRNEKLILFHILFFVFMRPTFNLENIEIM